MYLLQMSVFNNCKGIMDYTTLSDTGLLISKLLLRDHDVRDENGFFKAIGSLDQAGADERVRTSTDASIDFFDTADNYAEGESENTLRAIPEEL
jgi:aryl-alcohol dehydrogenase-like predicted oxidoreductase